ncbi:MAG: hypothetical protein LDL16_00130 [Thiobacillus sp.]|nr:hypothetical protein [Thiobacillus sp.]
MGATLKSAWVLAGLLLTGQAIAAIDPTAPPGSQAGKGGAQPRAELAWVRVNGKQSVAWYGGTTVRLGETVEGGRVVAIREDGIVIAGPAGRRKVYLLDPAVRIRPSKNKH